MIGGLILIDHRERENIGANLIPNRVHIQQHSQVLANKVPILLARSYKFMGFPTTKSIARHIETLMISHTFLDRNFHEDRTDQVSK